MHMTSGLFLTANYGSGDGSLGGGPTGYFWFNNSGVDTEGFALTGGIERKWFDIGRTTLFGEWGKVEASASAASTDFPPCNGPGSCFERAEISVDYFGGGIVQSIDAAAMDLYLTVRKYDGDLSQSTGGCDAFEDGDVCGSWGGSLNVDATVGMVGARLKF
jgi:hypothetical protein